MKWQYIVIVLILANILWYNFKLRRDQGIILDLWTFSHYTSWLWYFLIYLVADSVLNYAAVGNALTNISIGLNQAFNVVCVGYVSMWIGKVAYDVNSILGDSNKMSKLDRMVWVVFSDRKLRLIYVMMFAPFIAYILFFGITHIGSDIRELLGVSGILRPIMNVVMSAYPTIMLVYFMLYLQYHKRHHLYIALVLTVCSILLSSRSVAFTSAVTAFVYYSIHKGRNISIIKVVAFGVIAVIGVFALSFLRTGNLSQFGAVSMFANLLYGNTFSDIRDFAWVLGCWDGEFLWGKTYLAGLFSFVPSALSDFRQEWGFGRFTLHTTGLYSDDSFHGGLRCTIFGEPYFNFGFLGVILIAFLYGYLFERVNCNVVRYCRRGAYLKAFSSSVMLRILGCMMISSASFSIYLFFLPIIFIYLLAKYIDSTMGVMGKIRIIQKQ